MRTTPLALLLMIACNPSGQIGIKDLPLVDSGDPFGDADTDADADADADADTDADTDSDADADTADEPTGDTADEPPVDPPDWIVDCVPGAGDFTVIQDAIDASVSGDRIGVMPCTYHERIDFLGKTIELYGIDGSAVTIIDGDDQGTVVNIESGESLGTRMAGFTVTGGNDDDDGSAFQIEMSAVELQDIVMTGNGDSYAVLWANIGWVELTDVTISGNAVAAGGQAIWADSGTMTATNLVLDCDGGEQALWHHNALILHDSQFDCPTGHGLKDYHGENSIRRSIMTGGISGIYAYDTESTDEEPDNPNERLDIANTIAIGGQFGVQTLYMDLTLHNSVLIGGDSALSMTEMMASSSATSTVFTGGTCGITGDQPFTASYSAFWNNGTDGCGVNVSPAVTSDPLFVAFPFDLHPQAGSPLVDAGNPGSSYDDIDGSRNDIGAFGGPLALP